MVLDLARCNSNLQSKKSSPVQELHDNCAVTNHFLHRFKACSAEGNSMSGAVILVNDQWLEISYSLE